MHLTSTNMPVDKLKDALAKVGLGECSLAVLAGRACWVCLLLLLMGCTARKRWPRRHESLAGAAAAACVSRLMCQSCPRWGCHLLLPLLPLLPFNSVCCFLTAPFRSIQAINLHLHLPQAKEYGIRNILALRGDPPKGQDHFEQVGGGSFCMVLMGRAEADGCWYERAMPWWGRRNGLSSASPAG